MFRTRTAGDKCLAPEPLWISIWRQNRWRKNVWHQKRWRHIFGTKTTVDKCLAPEPLASAFQTPTVGISVPKPSRFAPCRRRHHELEKLVLRLTTCRRPSPGAQSAVQPLQLHPIKTWFSTSSAPCTPFVICQNVIPLYEFDPKDAFQLMKTWNIYIYFQYDINI